MLLPIFFLMASNIQPEATGVPFRQPQLAAAHGKVVMTFGGGSTIYFTSSPDQGRTFAAPVKVAETGALALGKHRGPRVVILKDAMVISAVAGKTVATGPHAHGLPEHGELTVWRSTDQGKSWRRAAVINDVPGAAREGLHAMAADAQGNLFAAWLDLRSSGTKLYGSRSSDGGLTWSKNQLIYAAPGGTICQCCDPSLAVDESGRIFIMWRNVVEGSRDLYFTSTTDGVHFEPARKLGVGTWKIDACPMDGGGIAFNDGKLVSAWRRDGEVFLSEPGKAEKRIGTGKDVAITRGRQGIYVAFTNGESIQILGPKNTEPSELARHGAFANLVALPDGSIAAAWEANGTIETSHLN
jgi:hypothetical protein